jgi:hypothetical protein
MKNYLKFIVAVFGVTITLLSSISSKAQKSPGKKPGSCTLTMDVCGTTSGGNVIDGKYNK